MFFSALIGRYPDSGWVSPGLLETNKMAQNIVWNIRTPRIIVAVLLGMSLAVSGNVMQMIFGNPLVNPGFLGVSQGAAFGAALCILYFGNSAFSIQLVSALFACLGLAISYYIAWKIKFGSWILRLILSGISVSAIFASMLGLMKFIADPTHQLSEITFWLLGGLSAISWDEVFRILPVVLPSLVIVYLFRWRLNLLALKESSAFSLGVSVNFERFCLLGLAVLMSAAVTAVAGLVGWVGLIVPHLSRRIFGADANFSVPGSILLGGIIVLACDDFCRTIFPGEIPLGIATSLVGAIAFLVIMTTGNRITKE